MRGGYREKKRHRKRETKKEGSKAASGRKGKCSPLESNRPHDICDLGEDTFPERMEEMSWVHRCSCFVLAVSGLSVFNKEKEQIRAGSAGGFMTILPASKIKNTLQRCEVICRRPRGQAPLCAIHLSTCSWVCSSAQGSENRRQLPKIPCIFPCFHCTSEANHVSFRAIVHYGEAQSWS